MEVKTYTYLLLSFCFSVTVAPKYFNYFFRKEFMVGNAINCLFFSSAFFFYQLPRLSKAHCWHSFLAVPPTFTTLLKSWADLVRREIKIISRYIHTYVCVTNYAIWFTQMVCFRWFYQFSLASSASNLNSITAFSCLQTLSINVRPLANLNHNGYRFSFPISWLTFTLLPQFSKKSR